jgi:hypothetical protein
MNHNPGPGWQRSEHVATQVVALVMVTRVQELVFMEFVFSELMFALAVLVGPGHRHDPGREHEQEPECEAAEPAAKRHLLPGHKA